MQTSIEKIAATRHVTAVDLIEEIIETEDAIHNINTNGGNSLFHHVEMLHTLTIKLMHLTENLLTQQLGYRCYIEEDTLWLFPSQEGDVAIETTVANYSPETRIAHDISCWESGEKIRIQLNPRNNEIAMPVWIIKKILLQ